jgi:hypothetical protein
MAACVAIFASLAASLCASLGALGASLALGGIAALALISLAFQLMGGFNNLLFVFVGFHLLYGLSGPVNALYGESIASPFSLPYETGAFLAAFAYSTAALALALLLAGPFFPAASSPRRFIDVDPALLGRMALIFAAFSTVLELSNLLRVGPTVAFEGKAIYQSAVDALTVTAPSYEVSRIAFCLLGLAVAGTREAKARSPEYKGGRYGALFLLLLLPMLLLTVLLGRRGPMLDWIFIYFVASTWYQSRRRIGRAVAVGTVVIYLAMGMLFANRAVLAYAFLINDFSTLGEHATQPEVIVSALNPGGNEFGAAFGNFSEYVKYDVEGPQYGRTYLEGAALILPSFLYPGTKPQPVAYAFRDRFFPGIADEGAIASTAYSSLLEAYVNFRQAGVVMVYFVIGLVLMWIEARRRESSSLARAMIYLSLLPSAFVFHRADFGASVVAPMFYSLVFIAGTMALLYVFRSVGRGTSPVPAVSAPTDA